MTPVIWISLGILAVLLIGLTYLVITHKLDLHKLGAILSDDTEAAMKTLHGKLDTLMEQVRMVHTAVQMPLQVVSSSPVASTAPTPAVLQHSTYNPDSYPDAGSKYAAWLSAGRPAVDLLGRALDVRGALITDVAPNSGGGDERQLELGTNVNAGTHPLVDLPVGGSVEKPFGPFPAGTRVKVGTIIYSGLGSRIQLELIQGANTIASAVGYFQAEAYATLVAAEGVVYTARLKNLDTQPMSVHVQLFPG